MIKTVLNGETFRRIIISILILSMMLTFGTAFVSHEPPSLREIDPYYFDSNMLPSMTDEQMLNMESQLVSDLSRERNELSELTPEELEESMRALREYNLREMTEFVALLNSGLSYSELTEDNRVFLFTHLDISDAANSITNQLFMTMERDGFTLPESVELVMIMSGGLFDYVEAQKLLRSALSTQERVMDVLRFEHFAQRFDIAGEVNARRLVNRSFVSINEFTETGFGRLVDISELLNAERVEIQYSFVEAVRNYEREVAAEAISDFEERLSERSARMELEEQYLHGEEFSELAEIESRRTATGAWSIIEEFTQEEYVVARATFTAFTNERAFSEARGMFLNNYSSTEIETAFALGAALGAEPRTYILSSDTRRSTSQALANGTTSADDLATVLFADVIRQNPERRESDPQVIEPDMPPNYAEFEAMLSAISANPDEANGTLHTGMSIMNLGGASIAPMSVTHEDIISNPFNMHFNANESVCLNTGAVRYRVNILSLPGRGGFGFNLDMVYNSGDADLRRPGTNSPSAAGRHGLGVGWKFDLPHILDNVLYVSGRGSFALNGNTIVDYTLQDMRLFNDTSFTAANRTSTRRLTFLNGTSYFFSGNLLIGMRDRFGNTITYEYTTVSGWGAHPLLSRVTDTNGKHINFSYQISGNNRSVTIIDPGGGKFTINMSRITGTGFQGCCDIIANPGTHPFQIDNIINQVGAVMEFGYWVSRFFYDFNSKTPRHRSYSVMLIHVVESSRLRLIFTTDWRTTNMGRNGSRNSNIVTHRLLFTDFNSTIKNTFFSYQGDPTAFPQWVDRPPANYTYSTTVTQNNGLRTVYTFNHLHLNTLQRTYNGKNTLLSTQTIMYNNDRLPTNITLTEHRAGRTRETTQQFTYNRYGQVTQSVSPLAQGSTLERYRTDYTYDNRFGLPLTTTLRPDVTTTVVERNTLSDDGRRIVRTVIEENGTRQSRTDFEHDAHGNVTRIREFPNNVTDASTDFITTEITFDRGTMPSSIRTINVRDANNALVGGNGIVERRFSHDQMWRTLSETDPNGYMTHWQYDDIGRITRIDFPNGGFVTYAYNDRQRSVTHQTIFGATYTYRYDKLGNLISITAPNGVVILSNVYDDRMRLVETRNAQGIASSVRTTFEYDIFDRVIDTLSLNSAGVVMRREEIVHNDISNSMGDSRIETRVHGGVNAPDIVSFAQFDRFGRLTQKGVIGGGSINYTHDLAGRVVRESSLGIDNTFTYNIFGVTSVRNIEGNTSRKTYDSMGRLLSVSDFMGNVQRFTYDALGRLIRREVPFERVANITYHAISRYFYDRNGNVLRAENLVNLPGRAQVWAGTENTFRHNMLISSQTGGADGIRAEYTYDLAGNILTKRIGDAVTTYTYNNRGQLTQIRDALGQVESFTYDANGLLLTRTDRNGTLFRMTYNNMGRLIREEAFVNGVSQGFRAYTFYATGALLSETNGTHTITYRYDAQGRINWVEETGGIVRTYTYNVANNVLNSRVTINGFVHQNNIYTYDAAQRLRTVSTNGVLRSTYSYNANGSRVSKVLSNGVRTDYTHNLAGLITNLTNRHGTNILSSFAYTHYLDGNTSRVVETMDGETRTITYIYDLARRLVQEEVLSYEDVQITTWVELQNVINSIPTNTAIIIQISGSFTAPSGSDGNAITIPANRNITLVSDNATVRTLTQTNNGQRHFIVSQGASLTLGNGITLSGGVANNTNNSGGVQVNSGGTLTMLDGSVIENCRRTTLATGGAVQLQGSGSAVGTRAMFNMTGGTIRNNSGTSGGGVNVGTNSTFTMSGGVISGNANGGVRLMFSGSIFAMNGGTIENNTNTGANGAGVHVAVGTFTMSGGTIRNNQQNGGATANSGGGGVRIAGGTFTMNGASARIENNAANGTATTAGGGGIRHAGGTVNITAGTIANNTSTRQGGGIHSNANHTNLNIGTNAIISNNTPDAIWPAIVEGAPTHVVIETIGGWGVTLRPCFDVWGCCSTAQLRAIVHPLGADQSVVWSSDVPDVVSVDQSGFVSLDICCCDGFCLWCCDAFALITATAINGVVGAFLMQLDVLWRGYDEPDDPPLADYVIDDFVYVYIDYHAGEFGRILEYYVLGIEYPLPRCCEDCVRETFDMAVLYETDTEKMSPMSAVIPVTTIRSYTFDNRGNRITMTVTGLKNHTVTYTYDLNNRLLSSTRTGDGAETSTYAYDHNGNQLTKTTGNRTETRTYNAFNQLTRVEMQGIIATYSYRADGLRHSKTINAVTTTHVWNGGNIVLELNTSGGVINVFNHDARGNLLRSMQHGFYLFNARGDVVQRVDAQGVVLHTYRYDAFGNDLNEDSRNTNPFRFASMYWDAHTQTYMTPNRHFNPRTGRWTQPDPYWGIHNMQANPCAILQAANLYVFVGNNPVMFIDPSGLVRVNTVEYARAQGATITNLAPAADGRARIQISYNGISMNITVNSGFIQDSVLNDRFGWTNPFIASGQSQAVFMGAHTALRSVSEFFGRTDQHVSIVIFACRDSSLVTGTHGHHFRNGPFGMLYATIGGGWQSGAGQRFNQELTELTGPPTAGMRLYGEINHRRDTNLSNNNIFLNLNTYCVITINSLFTATNFFNEHYSSRVAYGLIPAANSRYFNSSSFAHGLLIATGINRPNLVANHPDLRFPGWDKPLPLRAFTVIPR